MTSNKHCRFLTVAKAAWSILLCSLCAVTGFAEVADLNVGTVQLLEGWTQKRTGTKDSEMGQITRPDGRLIVNYDIGFLAGTHMSEQRKAECIWFKEQMIHGNRAIIGLVKTKEARELVVTLLGPDIREPFKYPANFWATVQNDEDITDVLLVALSYKPNS